MTTVERFAPEVESVLREAGWSEGRRAESRVAAFSAVVDALLEFGGLYVIQDGPGRHVRRRPFALDPALDATSTKTLAELKGLLGHRVFPLGMEGDHDAILVIDETGRVFSIDHAGEWFLGATIDDALVTLVTGRLPPRLDDDGRW
ncbi:SUKH-3 domain-containing protein [Tenggerimyces flavus]|uniref:SUKH-3 domain-containing protein n=1 Tax=Tenggerimyces flavus TaxID=1708749 RepID=A0ABV7YMW8_9ACTN|nr:SUKH-3 domain-containing protein [Tenggerimyces flavus]MBM7790178.1 hypothetical protein [Tenggerimyces flavus]